MSSRGPVTVVLDCPSDSQVGVSGEDVPDVLGQFGSSARNRYADLRRRIGTHSAEEVGCPWYVYLAPRARTLSRLWKTSPIA